MNVDDQKVLFPSQARTLEALEAALGQTNMVGLVGRAGTGKTEIARAIVGAFDGCHLTLDDYVELAAAMPATNWTDRLGALIDDRLARYPMIAIDDCTYLKAIDDSWWTHLRKGLVEKAKRLGKRVLLVGRHVCLEGEPGDSGEQAEQRATWVYDGHTVQLVGMAPILQIEDLETLGAGVLGADLMAQIDCDVVQLHAAGLAVREWLLVCHILRSSRGAVGTRQAIDAINAHVLHQNVRLSDVETLSFDTLPGTEEIAEALEKHVVMPFEHPEEAQRLRVKARRGVMLFGPPGTGKTSIGRALAHRMKGKFFVIDGSIPTEPPHMFVARIEAIIDRAIRNAPSVLFIDDADNLFAIPYAAGIVRRLLSLLDGMESKTASKVCVMMTVMDPIHVPDALVRSGRVELWLETTPPAADVRADMFRRWTGPQLPQHASIDYADLASRSEGFTPADIRRAMDDARLFYAQDRKEKRNPMAPTDYVIRAVDEIVAMRAAMARFLNDESLALGAGKMGDMAA